MGRVKIYSEDPPQDAEAIIFIFLLFLAALMGLGVGYWIWG